MQKKMPNNGILTKNGIRCRCTLGEARWVGTSVPGRYPGGALAIALSKHGGLEGGGGSVGSWGNRKWWTGRMCSAPLSVRHSSSRCHSGGRWANTKPNHGGQNRDDMEVSPIFSKGMREVPPPWLACQNMANILHLRNFGSPLLVVGPLSSPSRCLVFGLIFTPPQEES